MLEYLHPAGSDVVEELLRGWECPEQADADLRTLRREVDLMDRWCRTHVRWWGPRVDIGERHVLLSTNGSPKLIDLFFVEGNDLIAELIDDTRGFAKHVPRDRCRYLLDIADLNTDHTAEYLRRIRTALEERAG